MFIINPLNSVLDYLNNGKTNYFPSVKTIDSYKGQLSEAMQNKALIKLADPLPAVYAIMIDDSPISEEPVHHIDLLICADSKSFNKGEKQTAAYIASHAVCVRGLKPDGTDLNATGTGRTPCACVD